MADVEPDLAPASTSSTDYEVAHLTKGDQHVEQLLSEKLMKGYTLCNGGCPVCLTPLIKNELVNKQNRLTSPLSDADNKFPIIVASESFEQPFIPVAGVPFCVMCQAHVVTSEADVDALEQSESFKDKGSILVALQDDEQRESSDGSHGVEHVPSTTNNNPAADDGSEGDTSSFTKSLSSMMKESESILGRPVDPNRFTTTLFCGTTTSRQVVSSSPVNGHVVNEQVSDPYNEDFGGGEEEYDATAFADALEEDAEEMEDDLDEDVKEAVDEAQATSTDADEEEDEDDVEYDDVDPDDMMVEYNIR
jgi:Sjogren's syndrome/scleroderma autoantigen 1 (Autoantigen p27)